MRRKRITLESQKAMAGRLFVLPWVIGFIFFFAKPLIESLIYSFSKLNLSEGLSVSLIGFENYKQIFSDTQFITMLPKTIFNTVIDLPLIIFFSLFIAVIINQKFPGRTFVRSAFFLPVIITSGALIYVLSQDLGSTFTTGQVAKSGMPMVKTVDFKMLLLKLTNSKAFVTPIISAIDRVYTVIWKSGVQILLFLAGLQSISPSLYESAKVEGATGWEMFWKITVPMISPIIVVNVIYTVVDSFTDYSNDILRYIIDLCFKQVKYGYASAVSWIYFLIILIIMFIVIGILNKKVFYMNE